MTMQGTADGGAYQKTLMNLWIIWVAMMGSLAVYVFICHQFGEEIRPDMGPHFPMPLLRTILYVIAITTLFLNHFLKRRMLSGISRDTWSSAFRPGANSTQPAFLAKYTAALIVSFALSESIGIYGLVLFFLGDGLKTLSTFIGISALAIYFHRPKKSELEQLAAAVQTEEAPTAES
jgi:F0F1-type ATP synthase membrane subunit c/vacuolar-type H+-ATPase subunit K